jgi:hypothetical protein
MARLVVGQVEQQIENEEVWEVFLRPTPGCPGCLDLCTREKGHSVFTFILKLIPHFAIQRYNYALKTPFPVDELNFNVVVVDTGAIPLP